MHRDCQDLSFARRQHANKFGVAATDGDNFETEATEEPYYLSRCQAFQTHHQAVSAEVS